MLGDWGAHIIDFAHDFLKLGQPTQISPLLMEDHNNVIFPLSSHIKMQFPARSKKLPAWNSPGAMAAAITRRWPSSIMPAARPATGRGGHAPASGGWKIRSARSSHSGSSNIVSPIPNTASNTPRP